VTKNECKELSATVDEQKLFGYSKKLRIALTVSDSLKHPTRHPFPQDSSILCYFRYYSDSETTGALHSRKPLLINVIK